MKEYVLMFVVSFISATVLPAQSEAVLVALLAENTHSPWGLVATATMGNSLGAATNWIIGLFAHRFMNTRWFPVTSTRLLKAEAWYHKYGRWSLLLSWLPLIGDALTVVAGMLREPFRSFFPLTFTGKLLRYLALAWLYLAIV